MKYSFIVPSCCRKSDSIKIVKYLWVKIKEKAGNIVFNKLFPFWQFLGFHITPNGYYQPIPDTSKINLDCWGKNSELIGINLNEDAQIRLLASFASGYKAEYDKFVFEKDQISKPYEYYVNNKQYESVDGETLYCMIRHFKPNKIIEIGSGNSTYLAAKAVLMNAAEGSACKLIAIEPYPNEHLQKGFPGLYKLLPKKVEVIPLSEFTELRENDILFIDSSHVLKIGGDVQYECLEILPRLNRGVIIHFHDIFLPAEYLKEWVLRRHQFFTEQYLLQAFLAFNNAFEVLWAGHFMHLKHGDKLGKAFSSYKKEKSLPGSFWIRRTK